MTRETNMYTMHMNKTQEEMNRRNVRILVVGAILFVLFLGRSVFFLGYFPEPDDQAWSIGSVPSASRRYGQCDATDTCLFFSHWGKTSQIDVYSHDGTFLYSLEFQDISNGRIYIRCEENLLYIKLRNDNVFVFQGKTLLSGFSEKEADAHGFTNEWFDDEKSRLVADNGTLLYLDEDGQVIGTVTVPMQVSLPSNLVDFGPDANSLVVGACAIFVFGFILFHIFKNR